MDSLGDFCKQMMDTFSRKSVDDADKKSVSDAANVGLETRVIRTYDDVGLHGGKDDCEFCKSREGEWSYQEAIARGIFARHPGCECEIDYKTKKGSWQRQSNWKYNEWKDVQDPQKIEYRKSFMGIPIRGREDIRAIPKSVGARVFKNSIIDFETGMEYHIGGNGRVSNVETFAGKGSKNKYHNAYKYSSKYGGLPEEWKHMKGKAYIENDYESGFAEIHWSEHDEYGSYDPFVKKWL